MTFLSIFWSKMLVKKQNKKKFSLKSKNVIFQGTWFFIGINKSLVWF